MGDISDSVFNFHVSLLIAVSVVLEAFQLLVYAVGKSAHMPVSAGEVDQCVGVG